MSVKDSNTRSLVKAVSWRMIGTIDTIVVSFLITGNETVALSIGATELITKTALYFLHERGWNKVTWGREYSYTSHIRSVMKSVSWRIVGTLDTILLAWYFSGEIMTGLSIGLLELTTKVFLFYLHERGWAHIRWGRSVDK